MFYSLYEGQVGTRTVTGQLSLACEDKVPGVDCTLQALSSLIFALHVHIVLILYISLFTPLDVFFFGTAATPCSCCYCLHSVFFFLHVCAFVTF